jgi:hypothetical protein
MNYPLVVEVGEVGLLSAPFPEKSNTVALYDRVWLDRGHSLNRYTGEIEYLTEPVGFGDGVFGDGLFGWS